MGVTVNPKLKRASKTTKLAYQTGFGNTFSSEAVRGALPIGQNSPQRAPRGLYAEVISGTAFTAPRAENLSTWLYKLRPSAMHAPYRPLADRKTAGLLRSGPFDEVKTPPNRLRWDPLPIPSKPTDFIDGLVTIAGSGDPASHAGLGVHVYRANRSMTERYFSNADGEMMIVRIGKSILLPTRPRGPCAACSARRARSAVRTIGLTFTPGPAPPGFEHDGERV